MSLLHQGSTLQTQLQQAISEQLLPVAQGADVIGTLWQPDTCPAGLLPWLAWSQGVEHWDENWNEATKRKIIAQSYEQHKFLGTRFAVINGLAPFGYRTNIKEWFEKHPQGEPGTFSVDVSVTDKGINSELIEQIHASVTQTKRKSVQFDLSVSLLSESKIQLAAASCSSLSATVYPYFASEITSQTTLNVVTANQSINQIKVYPWSTYVDATILDHADASRPS
ncbi:phage tail protein I [Pseudoalteromonas sp. T1lg65]|uniref:phage tail protein I n=1 Tax=Pseudoalteromonas sp. T1lg65 TaxID=2077101 RepID=UPI003F7B30B7